MDVAVVILNWNGKDFLSKFLPSVVEFSKDATIYVIDNNSSDDSVDFLKEHYPAIKLVANTKNHGFAGGYNVGLAQIKAKYYVLLNSDVEVTANWLNPLINLMEGNSMIAACQPKVKMYSEKQLFEHAGAGGGFMDKNYYPFCRGRVFNHLEQDKQQYDDALEVFWASGACLFIRSEAYHNLNGLDDDFFAHMEEIDLCWRLKNQGQQIWYCGASTVYHVGGGTLDYQSPRKTFLNFRNSLLMITKNHRNSNLFFFLFKRLCLDGIAGAKFLFTGQFKYFFAVIKSHFAFYGMFKATLKKRKELIVKDSLNLTGLKQYSILWKAFVKKQTTYKALEK